MLFLGLTIFFSFVLFISVLLILELKVIHFEWLTLKGIKNSLKILTSLVATYIVLLAFLTFTFVFTFFRGDRFLASYVDPSFISITLTLLQSKPFFEHLTYFAALAGLFSYLDNNYMKLKKLNLKIDRTEEQIKVIDSKLSNLLVDIRRRKILQKNYKKNPEGLRQLEDPTKYEVNKERILDSERTVSKLELAKLKIKLSKAGRKRLKFLPGDIVITKDSCLHQIGNNFPPNKAMDLFKSNSLKAFYPIESQIDVD